MEIVTASSSQTLVLYETPPVLTKVLKKVPEHYRGLFLGLQRIHDTHHQSDDRLSRELLPWMREMLETVQGALFEEINWNSAQRGIDELKKPDGIIRTHFSIPDELCLEFDSLKYIEATASHPLASDLLTWMGSAKNTLQLTQAQEENELAKTALQESSEKYRESIESTKQMLAASSEKYKALTLETRELRESTQKETEKFLVDMKQENDAGLQRCAALVDEAAQIATKATRERMLAESYQAKAQAATKEALTKLGSLEANLHSKEAAIGSLQGRVRDLESRKPKNRGLCTIS